MLDRHIERAVGRERRREVDLQYPRFQIRVQQDVEAEHLKTVVAVHPVLFHGLKYIVVTACDCLQDHIVDTTPKQVHIDAYLLQMVTERCQAPLEANIVLLGVLVLHKLVVLLVDRVVRQVHIPVVFVELGRVALRCKPRQALLVAVNAQRLVARDHDIDAQIKFVTVDQQRISDVARDDARFVDIELVEGLDDVDSTATRGVCGLHNPNVALRLSLPQLLVVRMEVVELLW